MALEQAQVAQIVVGDLVRYDERDRLLMRAPFEESPGEVDVSAGRCERSERAQPRNDTNESLVGRPVRLEPARSRPNAIRHEAVLLQMDIGIDLLMQPLAEPLAVGDLEVIRPHGRPL